MYSASRPAFHSWLSNSLQTDAFPHPGYLHQRMGLSEHRMIRVVLPRSMHLHQAASQLLRGFASHRPRAGTAEQRRPARASTPVVNGGFVVAAQGGGEGAEVVGYGTECEYAASCSGQLVSGGQEFGVGVLHRGAVAEREGRAGREAEAGFAEQIVG